MNKFMLGMGITKEEYELLNNELLDLDPDYKDEDKVQPINYA